MSSFSARLLSSSRPRLGGRSASLQPLTQSNSSSIHVHRPISLLVTDSGRYILRNGAVGSGKKVGAGSSSSGSATKRSWSTSTKAFRPIGVLSTPTSAMSQQAAVAASAATSATLSTNSLSTLSVVAAAPPPINKAYIHQPAYEPNRTRRRFASSLDTSMTTAATRVSGDQMAEMAGKDAQRKTFVCNRNLIGHESWPFPFIDHLIADTFLFFFWLPAPLPPLAGSI